MTLLFIQQYKITIHIGYVSLLHCVLLFPFTLKHIECKLVLLDKGPLYDSNIAVNAAFTLTWFLDTGTK